jgi:hypothetical protein
MKCEANYKTAVRGMLGKRKFIEYNEKLKNATKVIDTC